MATLFEGGRPLVYQSSLNGKVFATQWTSYRGTAADGTVEIESFLEIDTAVLGQGGSPHRQRVLLACSTAFDPIRYLSESKGRVWSLDFDREQVTVHPPDGEASRTISRGDARYVLGNSGQQAIVVALLHEPGRFDGANLTVFLPDPLLAVPYDLSPAPELGAGWLRSSHEEELQVDGRGVMRECRMPKKGVRSVLLDLPPPLPAWRDEVSIAAPAFAYAPPPGARFKLLDVTIEGPVTPIGGTLSVPEGDGPFPAVLFLSGSGRHDRHGFAGEIDMGTHEIMDFLAEHGFLGLRYDTRGAGTTKFGHDVLDMGLAALDDDAYACFDFLSHRPETDIGRIFLIGHSQGATLALDLAAHGRVDPRGIVLMAGLGRTIDRVMYEQLESHGRVIGLSEAQIGAQQDELRTFVELAMSDRPSAPDELPDHLRPLVRSRKWLREHMERSPIDLIRHLHCPVLICQGAKDFQVSAERDAEPLAAAARRAGIDTELALFPDLDHLFKPVAGESKLAQYYDRSRRVSPALLRRVEHWLKAHC